MYIVPILTMGNIFLGIYYNLSIWYKLTNKTMAGAMITLIGVAITFAVNYFFIPRYSYMASAWATFFCYFSMMVISFAWGQKHYYVPYAWKKLLAYMISALLVFFVHQAVTSWYNNTLFSLGLAFVFIFAFALFVAKVERREFAQLPYVGVFVRRFL